LDFSRRFLHRQALLGVIASLLLVAPVSAATKLEAVVLNPDGAWCWFQDERALIYDGKMTVASITREGDVQVTTWEFSSGKISRVTLRKNFMHDDHNVPGLLMRNDGRLMAFYAMHNREPRMYYRVTTRPRDASRWDPEQSFSVGVTDRFTYANPFQLSAEGNRIYLFWRAIDFNPTWTASDDGGKTWRQGASHIYFEKGERPYVKYTSNGRDIIHFAFTEAHPDRPIQTSLYHAYYQGGYMRKSDGTVIRKLTEGPIKPSEATRVYDGTNPVTGEAWVWDIALDKSGNPVIAYTSRVSPLDHRYRYARWNGEVWKDEQIAFAGKRLYERELFYSGGIALDPDNTNVVYLSSDVNIQTGKPNQSSHYEIYRGAAIDGGATWSWTPITGNSQQDNLRPIVPAGHPGKTFVLWLRGAYRAYTDYETEVMACTDARLPAVTSRGFPSRTGLVAQSGR
jgi:hypothetical protein